MKSAFKKEIETIFNKRFLEKYPDKKQSFSHWLAERKAFIEMKFTIDTIVFIVSLVVLGFFFLSILFFDELVIKFALLCLASELLFVVLLLIPRMILRIMLRENDGIVGLVKTELKKFALEFYRPFLIKEEVTELIGCPFQSLNLQDLNISFNPYELGYDITNFNLELKGIFYEINYKANVFVISRCASRFMRDFGSPVKIKKQSVWSPCG